MDARVIFDDYGISADDFLRMEKEALKRPAQPYHIANEPLADAFFKAFKACHSKATYFKGDSGQYICLDERARKRLLKQLKENHRDRVKALERLTNLINEVEGALT